MDFKFTLGQKVKEKFTGFTGFIMAQTRYFNGCLKYGVTAINLDKDGKIPEWEWIDEAQLVAEMPGMGLSIEESIGGIQQTPPQE